MSDWLTFWDSSHAIYVNDRHKDVHYRDIARKIAALVPNRAARVLDYGCGEAVHADLVAAACAELLLCDPAQSVRRGVAARFSGNPKIRAIAPDDLQQWPDGALDLIVINSVVQYLTETELDALLTLSRRLLAPDGTLIVADVIAPGDGLIIDTLALLRYAVANGFLFAAAFGLVRTAFSPYSRLRATLKLARYSEADFVAKAAASGLAAERLPDNIGHNAARMTFRCRRA
jgi:SAM-dependent methyltransferase